MDRKIDVLIVELGKEPRLSTVVDDLEHLQQIVGSPIEAGCYLPQRVMLICNGEGKNMGLPPNRPNPTDSGDTICGTFCCAALRGSTSRPSPLPSRRSSRRTSPCPVWREAAGSDSPPPDPPSGDPALVRLTLDRQ